ncbi:MAG: hypothetical protein IPM91_20295 [Bacteroidetes bacterium]|nr:hypothetical protein [Bacteroidota bacterium]
MNADGIMGIFWKEGAIYADGIMGIILGGRRNGNTDETDLNDLRGWNYGHYFRRP